MLMRLDFVLCSAVGRGCLCLCQGVLAKACFPTISALSPSIRGAQHTIHQRYAVNIISIVFLYPGYGPCNAFLPAHRRTGVFLSWGSLNRPYSKPCNYYFTTYYYFYYYCYYCHC